MAKGPAKVPGTRATPPGTFPPEVEMAAMMQAQRAVVPREFIRAVYPVVEAVALSPEIPGMETPEDEQALVFLTHGGTKEHVFMVNDRLREGLLMALTEGLPDELKQNLLKKLTEIHVVTV